jgi:hypothetical protein
MFTFTLQHPRPPNAAPLARGCRLTGSTFSASALQRPLQPRPYLPARSTLSPRRYHPRPPALNAVQTLFEALLNIRYNQFLQQW